MIRLPDELHERLEHLAHANARSLNAEVVARLQASLKPASYREREAADATADDSAIAAKMRRMEELVQESTTASDA
ncbi:MAG: Arc family DNA-binding protein [Sphingomonadales bacterium]|nr:Arc family DNA-binding protein [Sphingomonadales bacterium]MDE2170640.1 Arc family DNA-binding protein [Sphingomonadales bacterium]